MQRFPALTTISMLFKILAVLVLIVGGLSGLVMAGQEFSLTLVIWIGTAIQALGLWAFSEMIAVTLAIEKNTWATHQALTTLPRQPQSPASPVAARPESGITAALHGTPAVPRPGERPFKDIADDIERRQPAR